MTRKSDKRRLASFSFLPINIPLPRPPKTRTSDFEMLNGVKSGFIFHTRIMTTDTLISRVQFDLTKEL